ncbi:TonB-dependent receptor [Sphingosinicella soli]|uniref:Outer membrane receptor protein involved in Fe transport n=1 Tax=Sphingosinicella soli TaxID=333708 RepID=A0A7W7AYP6_9SPHN|nr:TonB-dependent receptor [Sphingosinicella soli]MBB4630811.1 outer membrane receptor protein involved in Fe transport [Sphingosinicella soli]
MTFSREFRSSRLATTSIALAMLIPVAAQAETGAADSETDEIIVTAQKRDERILDVPAGISVISAERLRDLHATQLADVSSYIPAFQVDSGGSPGQTTISIRGIAPIGRASTVATYIDDAPVGSSTTYNGGNSFQLDLLPYDVKQYEILRGPQGTFYGASSMGGLLKYSLVSPSLDEFSVRAGGNLTAVESGGKLGGGVRASVSGPLVEGRLGFVASYALENTPGFIDNAATGERNQNGVEQQSARLGLYFEPMESLTIKVDGLWQRMKTRGNSSVPLSDGSLQPLLGDLEDNNLVDQPFLKTIKIVSGAIEYEGAQVTITSATSYADTDVSQTQDASYTYGVAFPFLGLPAAGKSIYSYELGLKKFTQEIRAQSNGSGPFEWTVGGFYTFEDSTNFQSPSALTMDGVSIPGVDPIFEAQLPSTYKEYAAFGNLNYAVSDRFEVFGGLRYAQNKQVFGQFATGIILPAPIALPDQKSKENVTTYSAGMRFKPSENIMIYTRVATGYRPGGPNLAIPGVSPTFKSDSLTNYEFGVKANTADNIFAIEAAAFRIDWKDIQLLTSQGGGFNYVVNGSEARSEGIEANVTLRPAGGLSINGTLAYIDSVLTADALPAGGIEGDRLPNVPKLSGSIAASYTQGLTDSWSGTFGFGLRMVDDRLSNLESAPAARRLPGYAALDLNASVTDGRFTFRLFAKNVTDKRAYSSYAILNNQATGAVTQVNAAIIQPRTIGAALDVQF